MKRASYDGRLVTVEEFMELAGPSWRESHRKPTCPVCNATVHPYGAHSPEATKRFDHRDSPAIPIFCPLSDAQGRYSALCVRDLDTRSGRRLRAIAMQPLDLAKTYAFVSKATSSSCSLAEFAELVRRADDRRIWCYVDLRDWAVPFILLSLGDFASGSTPFHFVMRRGRARGPSPWKDIRSAVVTRHFSDTGKRYNKGWAREISVSERVYRDVVAGIMPDRQVIDGLAAALLAAGVAPRGS